MLQIIGHRGARWLAVENSLEALRTALDAGADGVEIDVQLSSDGEPVVFHDDDLQRLTAVAGLLQRWPWRELRRLQQRDGDLQPQPIAHLDQVLDWWRGGPCWLNIELKVARGLPAKAVADLARVVARKLAVLPQDRLVVSSFSERALRELAELQPDWRLAALVEPPQQLEAVGDFWPLVCRPAAAQGLVSQIHPHYGLLAPERLVGFAERGWPVWAWTVNGGEAWEQMAPLAAAGQLHALITDDPAGLRHFCDLHASEWTVPVRGAQMPNRLDPHQLP